MATVSDVGFTLERYFPVALAESWDVNGLTVGDPGAAVSHVHLAVDPTVAVVEEAIAVGAQMLITHHPLMMRGATLLPRNSAKGAVVHRLIEANVALFNAHTNADASSGGVADGLARALDLHHTVPLVPSSEESAVGTGRKGVLAAPMTLRAFADHAAAAVPATAQGVRVAGDLAAMVQTVAVVGGSGDSFLDAAEAAGVDVYVTGDLRHHPALEFRESAQMRDGRPYLVDIPHAAAEFVWLHEFAERLRREPGLGVQVTVSTLSTDPWTARVGS
jgi:dinuclear metal center YbgI/SA1388 family protein